MWCRVTINRKKAESHGTTDTEFRIIFFYYLARLFNIGQMNGKDSQFRLETWQIVRPSYLLKSSRIEHTFKNNLLGCEYLEKRSKRKENGGN